MGCACSSANDLSGATRSPSGPKAGAKSGQDIRDEYKIGKLLGSGAFGQVRECRRRATNEVLAVKILERKSRETGHWSAEAMFRREVNLLGQLQHANIIKYVDFFEDPHFLYVVLERCTGGELFEQIIRAQRFSETDAAFLCKQMLNALAYCHSIGIVHRDVKAENFLFQTEDLSSELKLIDFGMSAQLPPGANHYLNEVCGSPHYLAPELIRRKYSFKADMWALGVLIYLMVFGRYPFDGNGTDVIIRQVLKKEVVFEAPNSAVQPSALAVAFMKSLLERDASKRPTAEEALRHPWIVQAESIEDRRAAAAAAAANAAAAAGALGSDLLACVKAAQRKVTLTRKKGPSKRAESRLNLLLRKAERDWAAGKACGVRVSPLNQAAGLKPEYARHDRRLNTAPSREVPNGLADLQALRFAATQTQLPSAGGAPGGSLAATGAPSVAASQETTCPPPSPAPPTASAEPALDAAAAFGEKGNGFDWDAAETHMREREEADGAPFERNERRAVTVSVNQRDAVAAATAASEEYYGQLNASALISTKGLPPGTLVPPVY